MSLYELVERLNDPAISQLHNRETLRQLQGLLSSDKERGLCRAQAIDAQVDSLLCWRLSCMIPQLSSVQLDRTSLQLTLQCLTLLWTKTSTSERRKETRRKGVELCDGLLLLWQTFPNDEIIVSSIRAILKSWIKLFSSDASVRHSLIRQSNLAPFLKQQLQHNQTSCMDVLNLMKHVVFRADDAQKTHLFDQWRDDVLGSFPSPNKSLSDETQSRADYVSAILWNWATSAHVARQMAANADVWGCFQRLFQYALSNRDTTVQRHLVSAVGTIISFFGDTNNKTINNDTQQQDQLIDTTASNDQENEPLEPPPLLQNQSWMLQSLIEVIHTTNDDDSRRRCLRTVRVLSSTTWGRTYLSRNNPTNEKPLLPLLLQILRRPERDVNVHIQICQTIVALEPCFAEEWVQSWIPHMEVALTQKVQDPKTDKGLMLSSLSALNVCIGANPLHESLRWNATDFYRQLAHLVGNYKDDADFCLRVAELLNHLARYDSEQCSKGTTGNRANNRNDLPDGEGDGSSLFCLAANSHVLEILCLLLSPSPLCPSFELQSSQQTTVDTLMLLINHPDERNKKALADHEEVLTALVNLCLVITKGTTKDEAKRIILALVPEL